MASAATISNVGFIYKRLYTDRAVGDMAMRDHPLFSKVAKEAGFTGSAFYYPVKYGNSQTVSSSFSNAQTQSTTQGYSRGVQFAASRKKKYGVITLDGEAMAASEGDKGAFLKLITTESDAVIEEVGDHLAHDLYRDGNGARGRVASESSEVLTLTNPDDARNFKVGMTLVADNAAAGSSLNSGSTYVTAVNLAAGTITVEDASDASIVANDYLFAQGDENAASMEGLAALFPLTAPVLASDSFRGVDRGVFPELLAGQRLDDTATPIEENMGLLGVKISQAGMRADTGYINPVNFWAMVRRLNARVEYDGGGGTADYGFEFVRIHTPAGSIKVFSDPDCPTNRGYVLNMSTLYLKHLKGLPHIVSDDGLNPGLRQTSDDGLEVRVRSWCNLICTKPGANGVFSI
jgi:hypothetical protein